jgi:D-sedoheptulose 7-phosphate isomerase
MTTTSTAAHQAAQTYIDGVKGVLDSLSLDEVSVVIDELWEAHQHGRQVFIVGNGGSASTASHMACDLAKTVMGKNVTPEARRFRVTSLVDNVPLMTAWANDVGYQVIFAEQLRALANPNDVLVVISASGNSPNIVSAVRAAHDLQLKSIGLLGCDGGEVKDLVHHAVLARTRDYGHIEDAHLMLNHLITSYFLREIGKSDVVASLE